MKYTFLILLGLLTVLSPLSVSALVSSPVPIGIDEQLSVKMIPENPGPLEETIIRVESYSTDLNGATMSWFVNGALVKKEIGGKQFTFTTGAVGTKTVVSLSIRKSDGGTLEKKFTFEPASVDVFYEAQTYTPPFYRGKALFSHQAKVKVVAIPNFKSSNGSVVDPSTLVYKWKKDFKVISEASGYGKNVLTIDGPILSQEIRVDLEVTSLTSNLIAKKVITLEPTEPYTLMYEDNPLYGILFNHTVGNRITMNREEIRIATFPFNFATTQRESESMDYVWKINGEEVPNQKNKASITLRSVDGEQGEATVGLRTSVAEKILQTFDTILTVRYEGKKQNN